MSRVGLHGTNEPGLIGQNISHGRIRVHNGAIKRLAKILPLGNTRDRLVAGAPQ